MGAHHRSSNPQLQTLRTWAVAGFEAIRIYYLRDEGTIRVIRILHGKRDVKRILEGEKGV
jgi:plasmid stabilization system protein ParE